MANSYPYLISHAVEVTPELGHLYLKGHGWLVLTKLFRAKFSTMVQTTAVKTQDEAVPLANRRADGIFQQIPVM